MIDLNDYYRIEKSAKDLEEQELKTLACYALKAAERRNELKKKFREYRPESPLEYRTGYHRDRDRILWSKAFKRLQHKTQVFPHYVEDHYKRRLTHSLEVAQIATTVARALELNQVATEAIALGHDLGHTPFGHAGEGALNEILTLKSNNLGEKIKKEIEDYKELDVKKIPIFGFDHCVHAIEVVSRIEKEYAPDYAGLNLTFDVRDGILKHMCSRDDKKKRPFSNIPEVVKFDKYKAFGDNKGSLEAQCVYFADKVTYLLGDIEDGIRPDILECEKLRRHAFFTQLQERYEKDRPGSKLKLDCKDDFMSFRSRVLTTLILDCINSANERIKQNKSSLKDVDGAIKHNGRIVFVSDNLEKSWWNFYNEFMVGNLFKNERVIACSFKAEKIVTGLFEAYWQEEGLIKKEYRQHCEKTYQGVGISNEKLLKLITIRNYIAGMTDAFATDQHSRLYMSSERIKF